MTTDPDLDRCLWALNAARHRWQRAIGENLNEPELPKRQAAAVGEVLMWAAALDEACGTRISSYTVDRTTKEPLLDGMRYARNRVAHSLVEAMNTESQQGMVFPMSFPMTFTHWVWRPAREIPPPLSGQGKSDATNGRLAAYQQHWEGCEIGQTLTELYNWFVAVQ